MVSIEFLLTSLVVVIIPGTGVLYTVSNGLFAGKKASIYAALGCTFGIIPALLASVFGLAALFHTSVLAFQIIKYVGVAYLLYLSWVMWRSASPLTFEDAKPQGRYRDVAVKGCLINILNPKLSVFFLAFLPQFVDSHVEQPLIDMCVLGVIFMLMTFGVFVVYGVMASSFSAQVVRSEKVAIAMQKMFAGSFAAMGLKLAMSERS